MAEPAILWFCSWCLARSFLAPPGPARDCAKCGFRMTACDSLAGLVVGIDAGRLGGTLLPRAVKALVALARFRGTFPRETT